MCVPGVQKINFKCKKERLNSSPWESSSSQKKFFKILNNEDYINNSLENSKPKIKNDEGITKSLKFNFMKDTINSKNKKILNSPQIWNEGIKQINNSQNKILLNNIKKYTQIPLKSQQNTKIDPFVSHCNCIENKISVRKNLDPYSLNKDLSLNSLQDNDKPNLDLKINMNNNKALVLNENKFPLNLPNESKSKEKIKNVLQLKYDKVLLKRL